MGTAAARSGVQNLPVGRLVHGHGGRCGVRMTPPLPATRPLPPPESPPGQQTDGAGTPIWHTVSVQDAIAHLATTSLGLSSGEAAQRLHVHGPNELKSLTRESAWRTLAAQFKNALIIILLCATAISGFLGHSLEAVVITVIVLFAVLLGFFQEYRASRALEALRQMAAPLARVLRDGEETVVPARDLVPGDVVVLRAGDRVPADIRLTQPRSQANRRRLKRRSAPSTTHGCRWGIAAT
jgi:Ca2+-transporting ATPase